MPMPYAGSQKVFASQQILMFVKMQWSCMAVWGQCLMQELKKLMRDASIFLHMDATVDISHFKIVKALWPETAGVYAGSEE